MKKPLKLLSVLLALSGTAGLGYSLYHHMNTPTETERVIAQAVSGTVRSKAESPVVRVVEGVSTTDTVKPAFIPTPTEIALVEANLAVAEALAVVAKVMANLPPTPAKMTEDAKSVAAESKQPKGTSTTTALTQPKLEATPNPLAQARAAEPLKALEVSEPRAPTVRKHIAEKAAPLRNRVNNEYKAFRDKVLSKSDLFAQ